MSGGDVRETRLHRNGPSPSVCVVIPTRDRPASLLRAVRSALNQTLPPVEVIVVVDGPDPLTEQAVRNLADSRVSHIVLDENLGPGGARNAGICATRCDWVAFLDDDDEWLPDKLDVQMTDLLVRADPARWVIGTGVEWRGEDVVHHWPRRAPRTGERIADYLFLRRTPGQTLIATPSILTSTRLSRENPFRVDLRTHEDFDWLLTLERAGARFAVTLETLVVVHAPLRRNSLSTRSGWQDSLAWALERRTDLGERAFAAFCFTEVARTARREGGVRAFLTVLTTGLAARPRPYDLARFLLVWVFPQSVRWRISEFVWRRRRRSGDAASPTSPPRAMEQVRRQ